MGLARFGPLRRCARCTPLAGNFSMLAARRSGNDRSFPRASRWLQSALAPLNLNSHAASQAAPVSADGGLVIWVTLFGIGGAAVSYYSTPLLLGKAMESCFESMDKELLGVDVEIGKLRVYPLSGVWHYKSFKIINPPGYKQECVMSADRIIVDFDMRKLWASRGKQVHVTSLRFENAHFYLEYSEEHGGASNFQVVNDIVNGPVQAPAAKAKEGSAAKTKEESARAWQFHKVVVIKPTIVYGSPGSESRLELKDVTYDDFDKQVGSSALDDCMHWVLGSVMKELMGNMSSFSFSGWLGS